jgi:hypothetical protein
MDKLLRISNIAALIVTIVINYLSNTGIFNESTMSTVSDRYQNLFTPAGYSFSIWGLIYLLLIGFIIYQARNSSTLTSHNAAERIGWWFVISCAANSLWVLAWLYDYTGTSVLLMVILLFSLIRIILRTGMEIHDVPFKTLAFVWWPFCIYSGWIAVALIANVAAYLTKIDWNGFGLTEITWTITMIGVAGLINLFMTWNRNMREFALTGIWGLVAVTVSNWDKNQEVSIVALSVSGLLLFSTFLHAYQNRRSIAHSLKLRYSAK